ncbi:MAG: hypothetical protein KKA90_03000 [Nanoarchaeota archaeon]|nr:hypothetical protein [Nanoarchaeota archaeon]
MTILEQLFTLQNTIMSNGFSFVFTAVEWLQSFLKSFVSFVTSGGAFTIGPTIIFFSIFAFFVGKFFFASGKGILYLIVLAFVVLGFVVLLFL